MSPAGLKKHIISLGWKRSPDNSHLSGNIVGVWNGASLRSIKKVCPWDPKAPPKLRRSEKRSSREKKDDEKKPTQDKKEEKDKDKEEKTIKLTGQCVNLEDKTAAPTKTSKPTAIPTGKSCTKDDQCSKLSFLCNTLPFSKPSCEKGKCTCGSSLKDIIDKFTCTEKDKKKCKCKKDEVSSCHEGKCVCEKSKPKDPKAKEKPKAKLEMGVRECNKAFDHPDVHESEMNMVALGTCLGAPKEMHAGSKPKTYWSTYGSTDYWLTISWQAGCVTSVDSVDPNYPLKKAGEKAKDRDEYCSHILFDLWDQCKFPVTDPKCNLDLASLTDLMLGTGNKGAGGARNVGCLRYEFIPKIPEGGKDGDYAEKKAKEDSDDLPAGGGSSIERKGAV